jgi:hypothetical protein
VCSSAYRNFRAGGEYGNIASTSPGDSDNNDLTFSDNGSGEGDDDDKDDVSCGAGAAVLSACCCIDIVACSLGRPRHQLTTLFWLCLLFFLFG